MDTKGRRVGRMNWKIEIDIDAVLCIKQIARLIGTALVNQWLRLCAPNTGGLVSTPVQGTRFHMLQLIPGTAK